MDFKRLTSSHKYHICMVAVYQAALYAIPPKKEDALLFVDASFMSTGGKAAGPVRAK
jgi:hypothetical protein